MMAQKKTKIGTVQMVGQKKWKKKHNFRFTFDLFQRWILMVSEKHVR